VTGSSPRRNSAEDFLVLEIHLQPLRGSPGCACRGWLERLKKYCGRRGVANGVCAAAGKCGGGRSFSVRAMGNRAHTA
jgi:hypothetical protein